MDKLKLSVTYTEIIIPEIQKKGQNIFDEVMKKILTLELHDRKKCIYVP